MSTAMIATVLLDDAEPQGCEKAGCDEPTQFVVVLPLHPNGERECRLCPSHIARLLADALAEDAFV
jgi:hypothetical protein